RQEEGEGFRRRQQDFRRVGPQTLPGGGRRIAGPQDHARQRPWLGKEGLESGKAGAQVLADVVAKGLERREIETADRCGRRQRQQLAQQGGEGSKRLTRAGRGAEQEIATGGDDGPGGALRRRRTAETLGKPRSDRARQRRQRVLVGVA